MTIELPEEYSGAVALTHDIDLINQTWKSKAILAKQGRYKEIIWKKEPYRNLDFFMDIEESCGAKGTYFVLALRKSEPHYNYDIHQYVDDFKEIIRRGHEIGLHGGLSAYNSSTKLIQEKASLEAALGCVVDGYRSHYVQLDLPETWQILSDMGFLYDATFFNWKHHPLRWNEWYPAMPFSPFRPISNKTRTEIDLWVVPQTYADFVLYDYSKFSNDQIYKRITKTIAEANRDKGFVSICWHNSSVRKGRDMVYKNIVKFCEEQGVWMPTCGELIQLLSGGVS